MGEKRYTVYRLVFPDGRIYVGKTCRPVKHRWGKEGRGYQVQPHVYEVICAFGWENIKKEILEAELSKQAAAEREQYYVALWDTMNPEHGLNRTAGGDGMYGWHPSEEQKEIIRETNRIRVISEESRRKNAESQRRNIERTGIVPFKGKHHTEETKRIIAEKAKARGGHPCSEEAKEKIAASKRGKKRGPMSDEWKAKIAKANTGRIKSEEERAKLSKASSGVGNGMYGKHGKDNPASKPVLQYALTGEFIAEYESAADAKSATGISNASIGSCANKKLHTAGGYMWRWKIENEIPLNIPPVTTTIHHNAICVVHRPDGTETEYPSVKIAAQAEGCQESTISRYLNQKRISLNGDVWSWKE